MLDTQIRIRLTENMADMLDYISETYNTNRSSIIRDLINRLFNSEKRKGVIKWNKITEEWKRGDDYIG